MERRAQVTQGSAETLAAASDLLRAKLERENAAARDACQRQEALHAGATVAGGDVAVGGGSESAPRARRACMA